jgi:hypothetical protein
MTAQKRHGMKAYRVIRHKAPRINLENSCGESSVSSCGRFTYVKVTLRKPWLEDQMGSRFGLSEMKRRISAVAGYRIAVFRNFPSLLVVWWTCSGARFVSTTCNMATMGIACSRSPVPSADYASVSSDFISII